MRETNENSMKPRLLTVMRAGDGNTFHEPHCGYEIVCLACTYGSKRVT